MVFFFPRTLWNGHIKRREEEDVEYLETEWKLWRRSSSARQHFFLMALIGGQRPVLCRLGGRLLLRRAGEGFLSRQCLRTRRHIGGEGEEVHRGRTQVVFLVLTKQRRIEGEAEEEDKEKKKEKKEVDSGSHSLCSRHVHNRVS